MKATTERTPENWAEIFNIRLLDADGWRQDKKELTQPITRDEFVRRARLSTCSGNLSSLKSD